MVLLKLRVLLKARSCVFLRLMEEEGNIGLVFFIDSTSQKFLRSSDLTSQSGSMLLSAALLVLLGFAPPASLTAESSITVRGIMRAVLKEDMILRRNVLLLVNLLEEFLYPTSVPLGLDLKDISLEGTLTTEIHNFVYTKSIILRINSFSGIIPYRD
ncbi:hypothetical protein MKW98_021130 [Papaver atlanticum]|uniref:DUF7794 domain-containing protein n=1 Tax=Papaver atlanticum TaxID=357466 RepID=A0AAD4TA07_9MAGN|nr:hypothetical protein MKW98_021130 [Papaver atlanticum]